MGAREAGIRYYGVMGTKRLKRQRREMAEEGARLLADRTMIVSKGVRLKPGTAEHRRALEKIASMLSDEEFQGLVASGTDAKGRPGRSVTRRRPRPT